MDQGRNYAVKRKLIEVALPLEAINRESAREKSIRHGHPSTLHLWWARRPLAAARAVLFAQLVDDPISHPDLFPTEEAQRVERERLHGIIERLVAWENIQDQKLLMEAHNEIVKSAPKDAVGKPQLPAVLDPFAGGGTIPLEAQRLGLEAHASDLNPVAVLINKALIEIPPKFAGQPPVFPDAADSKLGDWPGASGLAEDVRRYGAWMREQAEKKIGNLYPKATLSDGTKANVIAWIWARTVTCPNPGCGIQMPLVRSWWLGKKKGKEAYIVPEVVGTGADKHFEYSIGNDPNSGPSESEDGTVGRTGATCISCGTAVPLSYIRSEGTAGRMGAELMAVVAEGNRQRHYLPATSAQANAAQVLRPDNVPDGTIPVNPRDFKTRIYGLTEWADLFTNRQLTALTTFSDLVTSAREKVIADGGTPEYADAITTYLSMGVSRTADYSSNICTWHNSGEKMRNVFGRQAIPMAWDYTEVNPFSSSSGNFLGQVEWVAKAVEYAPATAEGFVAQADAASRSYQGLLVSTDPPYYDNIGYSDLSDFFYVWLRRTLRSVYPKIFSTMLVPKAEELVANTYRHGGKDKAKDFFEEGFRSVFAHIRQSENPAVGIGEYPITVWYAFKQSEADASGEASTGWETLLDGMIRSGWEITSTWPVRSELSNRILGSGKNALASSIVLSLRPRDENAPTIDRRGLIAALEAELPNALRKLQQGAVAPVDLPQAAIGPGMAVFSRYAAVLEPDGSKMSVRSALARINEILDQVLNEQEGDFDGPSRFAIAWYRQHGYNTSKFGDADNLARARNTSVDMLDKDGILVSRAGNVHLIKPADLDPEYDPIKDAHTSNWEALHHLIRVLESNGLAAAGAFLHTATSRPDAAVDPDLVKELAHLLFRVAEANGWTKDALSFNALVTSWPEVLDAARNASNNTHNQGQLDFEQEF